MKPILVCIAVTVAMVLVGASMTAQEMIPAPDPVGGAKIDAVVKPNASAPQSPTAETPPVPSANGARYRWFNGQWWYWTPQKQWVLYGGDRRPIAYDSIPRTPGFVPSTVYSAPYGGYYYPTPGYWAGYYPGVVVGVRPYGNVNVGAGRRVGVDVWGPHGAVRVGRMRVGW